MVFVIGVVPCKSSIPIDSLYQLQIELNNPLLADSSRVDLYNFLGKNLLYQDDSLAAYYANRAWKLSDSLYDRNTAAWAIYNQGQALKNLNNPDSALILYDESSARFKEIKNWEGYINVLMVAGTVSRWELYMHLASLRKYEEALLATQEYGFPFKEANCHRAIGRIYMDLGIFDQALDHINECLILDKRHRFNSRLANDYLELGTCYNRMNSYDSAGKAFQKAALLAEEHPEKQPINFFPRLYNKMAYLNFLKGEFEVSIKYYNMSKNANRIQNKRAEVFGWTFWGMAQALMALNQYEEAHEALINGLAAAGNDKNLNLRSMIYKSISKTYAYQNDYKNAYKAIWKHYEMEGILDAADEKLQLSISDFQNEIEKIENEKLKEEMEYALERKHVKQRTLLFWLVIILSLAGFITMYRFNSLKKETNKELWVKQKELEKHSEELEQINLAKDKFFSIISHDLRSPLNNVVGLTKIMHDQFDLLSKEEQRLYVGLIKDSSLNVQDLLENLLTWARSQRDEIQVKKEEFMVSEVFEDIKKVNQSFADNKKINLRFAECSQKVKLTTDRNILETVLRNLVSNALKFTPEEGCILLTNDKTEEGKVAISVSDNGQGMSQEVQDSLFEIGTNRSTPGTNKESGSGLGLILCKEFVEKLGGTILVQSKVGEGTVFTVVI